MDIRNSRFGLNVSSNVRKKPNTLMPFKMNINKNKLPNVDLSLSQYFSQSGGPNSILITNSDVIINNEIVKNIMKSQRLPYAFPKEHFKVDLFEHIGNIAAHIIKNEHDLSTIDFQENNYFASSDSNKKIEEIFKLINKVPINIRSIVIKNFPDAIFRYFKHSLLYFNKDSIFSLDSLMYSLINHYSNDMIKRYIDRLDGLKKLFNNGIMKKFNIQLDVSESSDFKLIYNMLKCRLLPLDEQYERFKQIKQEYEHQEMVIDIDNKEDGSKVKYVTCNGFMPLAEIESKHIDANTDIDKIRNILGRGSIKESTHKLISTQIPGVFAEEEIKDYFDNENCNPIVSLYYGLMNEYEVQPLSDRVNYLNAKIENDSLLQQVEQIGDINPINYVLRPEDFVRKIFFAEKRGGKFDKKGLFIDYNNLIVAIEIGRENAKIIYQN
ncbi:MAG: hypothetical protein LBC92_00180 [Rickettsiales bacterium]|nr:hypothetical protein [Rickettsiales bacterium]